MNDSILIKNLGVLKRDKDIVSWFRSKNVPVSFFGGKKLPLIFVIQKEIDSSLKEKTESAVHDFLALDSKYRDSISDLVYENYKKMLDLSDIKPLQIESKLDIWNYVHPQEIYLDQRERRDEDIYIQVACSCDWEQEHGLQLVFKKGQKITRVSEQDGHLTTSDAFDTLDSQDKLLSSF